MKFLMIVPSTIRGGVEEYALKITSAAVKEGWDVYAAFPKRDRTASLVQDLMTKGVQYHRLEIAETEERRLKRATKHFLRFLRTVALLLKIKPNVVQLVLPWPDRCLGSILACGFLRIPTVVRFGLVPGFMPFGNWRLKAYAWARARNQKWLAISENNRQLVSEIFQIPESKVIRIYNGSKVMSASTDKDSEDRKKMRSQVRQEIGLSEAHRIALTVGRLDVQKGYSDIIPTIPHITKDFPELKFVWVGEGEQRSDLVNKLREYGVEDKVLFLGYRSDVPRFLEAADIFLFPTHYEGGQSFAIAEAMAHGLPIVSSDASGIPEVIEDKVHGLLFRTGDSCDLLETLRWALRHPDKMQEMAQNAQLRVQDFSEEKMLNQTLELLHKLKGMSA